MYSIEKEDRGPVTPCFMGIRVLIGAPKMRTVLTGAKKISHSGLTSPEMALKFRRNDSYNYIVYVCNTAY